MFCLASAVRLHVDVIGENNRFGALDGERFCNVHIFAAAIPAPAGIAFGIFICQAGSLGFHHRPAGKVLAGDQLNILELAAALVLDGLGNLRIDRRERSAWSFGPGREIRWSCGWFSISCRRLGRAFFKTSRQRS